MEHALESARVVSIARRRSPPRWAVVAVESCVVGLLLLPAAALLWAALYRPSDGVDGGLVAFVAGAGLAVALSSCVAILIHVFPPVGIRDRR